MTGAHLNLNLRCRDKTTGQEMATGVNWKPNETAIIICDMWDRHWCSKAAKRVVELAKRIDEVIGVARNHGVLIIHAPSDVAGAYDATPARRRAKTAPSTPIPAERTLTEPPLNLDQEGTDCGCTPPCKSEQVWAKQISTITIEDLDAVTADLQEIWNLLEDRKIANVILCGVHLNVCVLKKPFGICKMRKLGKTVALLRDLTDTLFNSATAGINHFEGTDRVIRHIETHLCPSFTSKDITGNAPFRFQDDSRPQIV
jgi:nicotinamidase-related amidase